MDHITSKIGKAGAILAVLGILSAVLSLFNYNIRLLAWIDAWGNTMGWILRILFVVGGAALFYLFGNHDEEEDA